MSTSHRKLEARQPATIDFYTAYHRQFTTDGRRRATSAIIYTAKKMNTADVENTRLVHDFYNNKDEHSPPESKRLRLDDGCNNNLNSTLNSASKNTDRWPCPGDTSLVEAEILEDMGVSMLEDDASNESERCQLTHSLIPSPSTIAKIQRNDEREPINIVLEIGDPRNTEPAETEKARLHDEPYDDDAIYGVMANESGYSSRVEMDGVFTNGKQSFKDESSISEKSNIDQFYMYRKKKKMSFVGEDKFNKLSDEMILSILKWLPKKCLVRSMLVCKRWCQIARDEALWTRLDLGGKVLMEGTLGHILPRGVQILRLAQAEIADPVFSTTHEVQNDTPLFQPISEVLSEGFVSKLQYLDLSMAVISVEGLATLLFQCRLLKKLSLEKCMLDSACCEAISQNNELTVLNLTMCEGIDTECISDIMTLKNLSALNMSWCSLDSQSAAYLCKSLPQSVIRLNIAGCRKSLTDDDVRALSRSCPNLVELDLSDCTLLTINTVQNILTLTKLEHLSLSRCYNISPSAYLRLTYMPSLLYLDVFGLMGEQLLASLRANSGDTEINKFLYSSIARPTVGVRRTSIWGLRVRD